MFRGMNEKGMHYFFQVIFKVFFNFLFGWILPPPIVTFTCDCRVLQVNGGIYLQQQQNGCSVHLTYALFRRESRR